MCLGWKACRSRRSSSLLFSLPALLVAGVGVVVDPRPCQPYPLAMQPQTQPVPLAPPAACPAPQTSVLSARLYQVNEGATRADMLQALAVDCRGGRGTFSVNYQRDALQGADKCSFSGQRSIANDCQPRRASVQCECLSTGPGMGTGACLFSDGACYQMHFSS
jgi:hypothetical protein